MHRLAAKIALVVVLLGAGLAVAAKLDEDIWKLEERLLAPCCYKQTLQIHESPKASELRREIRERLVKGETVDAIEADMVRRFGPEVRAIPHGFSLGWMGLWPFGFALIFGITVLVRRARAVKQPATANATAPGDELEPVNEEMNDRIDDELDRL